MKKFLLPILLLILIGCMSSSNESASNGEGGSGSEIVGDVSYAEGDSTESRAAGWPVKLGSVFIFHSKYEARTDIPYNSILPAALTDNNGNFKLTNVKQGIYYIEANDNHGKAVTKKITVSTNDDSYNEGNFIVKKTSSLNCSITLDSSKVPILMEAKYTVFILGTRIYAKGDANKLNFSLEDIPYGTYTVRFKMSYSGVPLGEPKDIENVKFEPEIAENITITLP